MSPSTPGEPVANQYSIHGPPGTGKTTYLADQIQKAVAKFGSDKVLVSSFTRAGAREIASRGIPVERHMVGTLHAICRRALGAPKITESLVKEWNTAHKHFALSEQMAQGGEPESGGSTDADQIYQRIQILRARLWDERMWPPYVLPFWRAWTEFKKETDSLDFTDLIAHCLEYVDYPPGAPNVMVVDETQDHTALELALVRKWGAETDFFLLGGDADQCIYSFRGATPDAFLDPPCPEENRRVLPQSYRVPRAIHAASQQWIMRVERREPAVYRPRVDPEGRTVEGAIQYCPSTYKDAPALLSYAEPFIAAGKTVMFLGACGYHVDPIKYELRKQAIPYHNPYRTSRGDWNPLGKKAGTSTVDRLTAFLGPKTRGPRIAREVGFWTADELRLWTGMIRAQDVLVRGAKTTIEKLKGERPIPTRQLQAYFIPEALTRALECEPEWLRTHLTSTAASVADYPIRLVTTRGLDALKDEPKVITGTIHSVKGGEAQCSPPDEPVLTANRGYVPIAELDPDKDYLVSFNSDHHKIHRGGPKRPDGYHFTMASRPYHGELLTLTTDGSRTRVTPNHWLTVRWKEDALEKCWAVYMMRRGNWWRIGVTKLHHRNVRSATVSGVLMRMTGEKADDAWILETHVNLHDALYAETILGNQYGVPDLNFEVTGSDSYRETRLSSDDLHRVWGRLDTAGAANALLRACGRDPRWPMWSRDEGRRIRQTGLRNRWPIRASNLLPELMELPTDPAYISADQIESSSKFAPVRQRIMPVLGQNPTWRSFTIDREQYNGLVYSLDVERWHHYISGGAVVHNCVVLIPDLSIAGMTEWTKTRTSRDPIIRQFYVGLTRARETLIVCRKFGYGVDLPNRAPDRSSEEI